METNSDHENTPEAKRKRRERWNRRAFSLKHAASARFERASAILLRAALNFLRGQNKALFPAAHIEMGHIWQASDELYGGRPPRGILPACEATAIAKMMQPIFSAPDADYPKLSLAQIKKAYEIARGMTTTARLHEEREARAALAKEHCARFSAYLVDVFQPEQARMKTALAA